MRTQLMAGKKVLILFGLFESELYVEFQGQKHDPFYPEAGPIPLHTIALLRRQIQRNK
jgi:hypothetical protein